MRWQFAEGYVIESVNRALSTFKAYAKEALKAGTLDATSYALIRAIDSYGYTEGKRVDEKREVTQCGAKKAQPTLISHAHVSC